MVRRCFAIILILGLVTVCHAAWDILDEDCSDISDWGDAKDAGGGSYSDVNPAGQFRFHADYFADLTYGFARRNREIPTPGTYTYEIKIYLDDVGNHPHKYFESSLREPNHRLILRWADDGLFVSNDSSFEEIGTNIVSPGTWQTWKFIVVTSISSMDVYIDGVLEYEDVECDYAGDGADEIFLKLFNGQSAETATVHIDYVKIATYTPDPSDPGGSPTSLPPSYNQALWLPGSGITWGE